MPPSDPAPEMFNSFHQCGRCARPLSWNGAGYHPCYSCGDIAENARLMSDPAAVPPPEWAVNLAKDYFGRPHVAFTKQGERGYFPDLARLLASVREGALREAAAKCDKIMDVAARLAKTNRKFVDSSAYYRGMEMGAFSASEDILSLIHTPPSGGAG